MKKLGLLFLVVAAVLFCGVLYAEDGAQPAPAQPAPENGQAQPAPEKPPVPPADPKYVQSMLEEITKYMTDKNYVNAGRTATRLLKTAGIDEATTQKCKDCLAEVNKVGTDKLTDAEGLVEKDFVAAVVIYNDLRNWPTDETRNKASQAIAKLNSTPEQQTAWKKATTEGAGRRELKSVEGDIEKKSYLSAMFRLNDLVKKYADTQVAKDCQAKLEELKKNNEYTEAVSKAKEKEIGRALQGIAFSYARFKQKDEAVNFHKIVIEKFPNTDLAKRCEDEVKRLTEEKAPVENDPAKPAEKAIDPEEMKKALLQQVGQNLCNLGLSFSRFGEKEEAIKFLQLAIEKFPETDVAKRADQQIKVLKGEVPAVDPNRRRRHVEEE